MRVTNARLYMFFRLLDACMRIHLRLMTYSGLRKPCNEIAKRIGHAHIICSLIVECIRESWRLIVKTNKHVSTLTI